MKKLLAFGIILMEIHLPSLPAKADSSSFPASVVGISLSKVMAALGGEQEALREEEAPTAILMYTADDRIETAFLKLKSQLKDYEHSRKVRVDFITTTQELPDYTEDFLNHLETAIDE